MGVGGQAFVSRGNPVNNQIGVSQNTPVRANRHRMEQYVIDSVSKDRQQYRTAIYVEGSIIGLDRGAWVLVEKKDVLRAEEIAKEYVKSNLPIRTMKTVDITSGREGMEPVPQILEIVDHMSGRMKEVLIFADEGTSQLEYTTKTLDALGFKYKIGWFDGVPVITEIMERGQNGGWGWQITINGEMPYVEENGERIYLSIDKVEMNYSTNTTLSYDYTVIAQQTGTGAYIFADILGHTGDNRIRKTRTYNLSDTMRQELPPLLQPKLDDQFLGKPQEYFAEELRQEKIAVQRLTVRVLPVEVFSSGGIHIANRLDFFLFKEIEEKLAGIRTRPDWGDMQVQNRFIFPSGHASPSLFERQMEHAGIATPYVALQTDSVAGMDGNALREEEKRRREFGISGAWSAPNGNSQGNAKSELKQTASALPGEKVHCSHPEENLPAPLKQRLAAPNEQGKPTQHRQGESSERKMRLAELKALLGITTAESMRMAQPKAIQAGKGREKLGLSKNVGKTSEGAIKKAEAALGKPTAKPASQLKEGKRRENAEEKKRRDNEKGKKKGERERRKHFLNSNAGLVRGRVGLGAAAPGQGRKKQGKREERERKKCAEMQPFFVFGIKWERG